MFEPYTHTALDVTSGDLFAWSPAKLARVGGSKLALMSCQGHQSSVANQVVAYLVVVDFFQGQVYWLEGGEAAAQGCLTHFG